MKQIPNLYTQRMFQQACFEGLDGELVVGNPYDKNLMQQTQSGVMSVDGEPDVSWHIFDKWDAPEEYRFRAHCAKLLTRPSEGVVWVPHRVVRSFDDIKLLEEIALNAGYEGIMLRDPNGPYKQGRSTLREGYLLKVKRFEDSEAEVVGFKEQMRNDNVATTDARGYTKRSTHAEGKSAAGVLGALLVRDIHSGVEFDIGTGFTAEQRANLWEGRKYLIGKIAKYKHFPIGVVDAPRFPTFIGWRDRRDM
jgi:DNA ligase-1